jgi:tetratricopeptide (TPR) repeat protein
LKRFALLATMMLGFAVAIAATTPSAQAGLFGGKAAASPSPSPSPSALPTATPEPPDVAIPRLQAKLKNNPNDQQAMTELATNLLQVNRPDLAVQLTQRLLQMGDKTAQVYYIDGFAQSAVGNIQVAVADLEQASNLDPTNMGVLAQLSELYLRTNRASDAERVAKRAVTFNKTEPQAYFTLGAVYAAEGHYDDARAQFEEAGRLNPKDSRADFQIASTYAQQNNIPMALTSVDRVLQLDPKNTQALLFKAQLYAAQHDDAKTAQAFDDAAVAATSDDEKVSMLVTKAKYFASEKKNSEAEAVFAQILAQYPKVGAAHVAFADYWVSQKQFGKAQTELQAALSINKDDPAALVRLGQLSMQQGKVSDAIGYLKHATDIAPDAQALAMLGQAYSYTHNYQQAKDACSKSFSIAASPQMLACVAGADYELKNYSEAARIFDTLDLRAHGYLEQNPDMLYIAGKTYEQSHQNAKAVSVYKRLLPMMKKGTKVYNQIQASITDLSRPQKR